MRNSLIYHLSNIGFTTSYLAEKYLGIKHDRLNKMVKNNILDKTTSVLYSCNQHIYTLSNKSLSSLRKKGIFIYKYDISQIEHDYILSKVYLSISSEEKLTWQNETALKSKFGKNTDTCDAMFVKNNKIIGVEIITPDYRKANIESKLNFMKKYCDDTIILNTKEFRR